MDKKKNIIVVIIVILLVIVAVALGIFITNRKTSEQLAIENYKSKEPEPEPEKPKLEIIDLNSKTRPIAVVVNNTPVAVKVQQGLNNAYIVYEFPTEGGTSRLMALFKDIESEKIGSIRSARIQYLDYVLENDAIYVHHGKSPQAQSDFSALKIDRIEIDNDILKIKL